MLKNGMRRLCALLLMLLMLIPQAVLAGEQAIMNLLVRVPASLYDAKYLSFVDLQALLGDKLPQSPGDADSFLLSEEGKAYIQALRGMPGLFSPLQLNLFRMGEVKKSTGLDIFQVRQALTLSNPPYMSVFLQGDFNQEQVKAALLAKGYQQMEGLNLWCDEGDCSTGARFDLSSRDAAFLFGGDLGRKRPVALQEGLVASGLDMEGMAKGQGPMLSENAVIQALVKAIASPDGKKEGQVAQLMLLEADLGLPSPLALAHVEGDEALWVVMALPYGDVASAEAARERISKSMPEASLSTRQSLMGRLEDMAGSLEELRVSDDHVLVIPLRFPKEREADAAHPFAVFVQIALRRDLGWLLTD